jgi:ribose-phosphate pyrophosphokinase
VARVDGSPLTRLVTTDSIAATPEVLAAKRIQQIPIAPLLAEAVIRISQERSVSSLFS